MLLDPRGEFGCPDCQDQGGYYIEFTLLGITKCFRVDKEHEPFYYKSLTKDLDILLKRAESQFMLKGR